MSWDGPAVTESCGNCAHELLDRRFGIEADLDRVGAHERAAEDAAGQARDVVALERLERRRPRSSSRWQSGAATGRGARALRAASAPTSPRAWSAASAAVKLGIMLGSRSRPVKLSPRLADPRGQVAASASNRPIAATPAAPVAATASIRSIDTPPMASTGTRTARTIAAQPAQPEMPAAGRASTPSETPCPPSGSLRPAPRAPLRRRRAPIARSETRRAPSIARGQRDGIAAQVDAVGAPTRVATSSRSLTTTRVGVPRARSTRSPQATGAPTRRDRVPGSG